jgi:protein phosphatase
MAARAVYDALRDRVGDASADAEQYAIALRDAVLAANTAIHQHALRHAELRGMGTTITAAALRGDTLYLAQVGDSRAYIVRDGVAQQITKDQSLMQKLVEAGEITPEQAETSVRRNIILQALGPESSVKVDLTHQQLRRGDLLLLCSDGLSGQVRAPELAEAVAGAHDLGALCRELIARANATGGPDNITVVAARFEGAGLADATRDDALGHQRFPLGTPTPVTPIQPVSVPVLEAPALALPVPGQATALPEPAAAPGVTPVELAERRDRAKVAYVGLAILAVVLAAVIAWRLLAPKV